MFTASHIPFIISIVLYLISSVWSVGHIIKPDLFNKKSGQMGNGNGLFNP